MIEIRETELRTQRVFERSKGRRGAGRRPVIAADGRLATYPSKIGSEAPRPRLGFTLVELLVVISLMLVLAGILVMFWPGVSDSQRAAEGGSAVQGWLKIAKQRALRDQAPRGVRFYLTTDDGVANRVLEAQYIEQPPDFSRGTVSIPSGSSIATISGTIDNGQAQKYWPVQPGDYLEIVTTGFLRRITGVGAAGNTMTLAWSDATPISASVYSVIRAPRVSGEEKLSLPTDIIVDMNTALTYAAYNGGQVPSMPAPDPSQPNEKQLDVLFSPSGNVIGSQSGCDIVNLWVRNKTATGASPEFEGEPTIIAVYTRSGLVAAYPPRHPTFPAASAMEHGPYKFVYDGGTQQ